MIALIEVIAGLVIGGVGFGRIAENPLEGSCALFLAGFLLLTGVEKTILGCSEKPGG